MPAVFLLILGVLFFYLTTTGKWKAILEVVKNKP